MRRQDIHTGDLLAWGHYRDGQSLPGVALGPFPMGGRTGEFFKTRGGAQYLLLVTLDGPVGKIIESAVDGGRTEPGEDFWGAGNHVRDYVFDMRDAAVSSGAVPAKSAPEGWRWHLVSASMIRGSYVPFRALDVRRQTAADAKADEQERARAANAERMARVRERLAAIGLDPAKADFVGWQPIASDPEVRLPISLLEMLLDDGVMG